MYCDGNYLKSGMVGEGIDSNSVLVVKTHGNNVSLWATHMLLSKSTLYNYIYMCWKLISIIKLMCIKNFRTFYIIIILYSL